MTVSKLQRLLQDIFVVQDSIVSKDTVNYQLLSAVHEQLSDQESRQKYPELWHHFELNPDAQIEYRALMRLEKLDKENKLIPPSYIPPVPPPVKPELVVNSEDDEPVLKKEKATNVLEQVLDPSSAWEEVIVSNVRGWIEKGTHQWRQLWLPLSNLSSGSDVAPVLSGLLNLSRTESTGEQATLQIAPEKANFEMVVSLFHHTQTKQETLCEIIATVELHERFGDFSGTAVTLLWEEKTYKQITNSLGQVTFVDLPYAQVPLMSLIVSFDE